MGEEQQAKERWLDRSIPIRAFHERDEESGPDRCAHSCRKEPTATMACARMCARSTWAGEDLGRHSDAQKGCEKDSNGQRACYNGRSSAAHSHLADELDANVPGRDRHKRGSRAVGIEGTRLQSGSKKRAEAIAHHD
eukprot:779047-Prymnesium_polylepis.1